MILAPKLARSLALLLLAAPLAADDGDLDVDFWTDGKLVISGGGSHHDARVVVSSPDDRLVFAYESSASPDSLYWRALGDSPPAPDACPTDFPGEEVGSVLGLAFDPQGRLLVGATLRSNSPGADYFSIVLRYLYPACQLDTTFAGDGRADLTWNLYDEVRLRALAVRNDGQILVATAGRDNIVDNNFVLFALTPGGGFDPLFSGDGRAAWEAAANAEPEAIVLVPNGDVLVAGTYDDGNADFAVSQWTPGGSMRSWVRAAFDLAEEATDRCLAAAVLADGRVAIAGVAEIDASSALAAVALVRPMPGGLYFWDSTFDGDGKRTLSFGLAWSEAEGVAAQGDGRIVVGGWSDGEAVDAEMAAARLETSGELDLSFGFFGTLRVDFDLGGNLDDRARSVALASGRIVLAGNAAAANGYTGVGLARLENAYVFADGFEFGSAGRWSSATGGL